MKSSTGYTRWGFSAALALLLVLSFTAPAEAFSWPWRHKQPAKNIPPSAGVSPDLMNPQQPGGPPEGNPVEQPNPPPPPDPVRQLTDNGILPADSVGRTTPMTRAELAATMVKALNYNVKMVSEFPFYRDVPLDHPAYVPIEVAREKQLILRDEDHGYYYPDKTITYADVYKAMANAIAGPPPVEEQAEQLLGSYTDQSELPTEMRLAVSKLARARFFHGETLHVNQPVTPEGLAPFMVDLLNLVKHNEPLVETRLATVPILPAGMRLTATPTTAILEARLNPGETLYFSLVYPVDPLPKGSRLRGTVREVVDEHTYIVEINQVQTPDDVIYQTSADLTLLFPPRKKVTFIVPGETFEATTRQPGTSTTTTGAPNTGTAPLPPGPPPAADKSLPPLPPANTPPPTKKQLKESKT